MDEEWAVASKENVSFISSSYRVVKRDAVGFVVLLDEHGYRSQVSASFSRVLREWMTNRGGDQLKSITMQSGTELK